MILVSMERGEPIVYYGAKQLYFGRVNFKFIEGGIHPHQEDVLHVQKGSVRRGLRDHNWVLFSHRPQCTVIFSSNFATLKKKK